MAKTKKKKDARLLDDRLDVLKPEAQGERPPPKAPTAGQLNVEAPAPQAQQQAVAQLDGKQGQAFRPVVAPDPAILQDQAAKQPTTVDAQGLPDVARPQFAAGAPTAPKAPLGTAERATEVKTEIKKTSKAATEKQLVDAFTETRIPPEISTAIQKDWPFDIEVTTPKSLAATSKFGDESFILDLIAGRQPTATIRGFQLRNINRFLKRHGLDPNTMQAIGQRGPSAGIIEGKDPRDVLGGETAVIGGSEFSLITDPKTGRIIYQAQPHTGAERSRAGRIQNPLVTGSLEEGDLEIGRSTVTTVEGPQGQKVFQMRGPKRVGVSQIGETEEAGPLEDPIAMRERLGIPASDRPMKLQQVNITERLKRAGDNPISLRRAVESIEDAYFTKVEQRDGQGFDLSSQKDYMIAKQKIWEADEAVRAVRDGSEHLDSLIRAMPNFKDEELIGAWDTAIRLDRRRLSQMPDFAATLVRVQVAMKRKGDEEGAKKLEAMKKDASITTTWNRMRDGGVFQSKSGDKLWIKSLAGIQPWTEDTPDKWVGSEELPAGLVGLDLEALKKEAYSGAVTKDSSQPTPGLKGMLQAVRKQMDEAGFDKKQQIEKLADLLFDPTFPAHLRQIIREQAKRSKLVQDALKFGQERLIREISEFQQLGAALGFPARRAAVGQEIEEAGVAKPRPGTPLDRVGKTTEEQSSAFIPPAQRVVPKSGIRRYSGNLMIP